MNFHLQTIENEPESNLLRSVLICNTLKHIQNQVGKDELGPLMRYISTMLPYGNYSEKPSSMDVLMDDSIETNKIVSSAVIDSDAKVMEVSINSERESGVRWGRHHGVSSLVEGSCISSATNTKTEEVSSCDKLVIPPLTEITSVDKRGENGGENTESTYLGCVSNDSLSLEFSVFQSQSSLPLVSGLGTKLTSLGATASMWDTPICLANSGVSRESEMTVNFMKQSTVHQSSSVDITSQKLLNFGDLDLSLYDFDGVLPSMSPTKLSPLTMEELVSQPPTSCRGNENPVDDLETIWQLLVGGMA